MQWMVAALWAGAVLVLGGSPRGARAMRRLMAAGLVTAMVVQLALLGLDGLLTLETGLPLHLCGLFGLLGLPLLYRCPAWLYELAAFLAAPAALVTLFFPAVIPCSHPALMKLAFSQLHALVALTPAFLWRTGKPLPTDARRALVLASGYLLFVSAFNRRFGTNYLFLRAAPQGTPLWTLLSQGGAYYICALALACMVLFSLLSGVYTWAGGLRKRDSGGAQP